jgi:hypothetical protein
MLCRLAFLFNIWRIENAFRTKRDVDVLAALQQLNQHHDNLFSLFEEILTSEVHEFALQAQVNRPAQHFLQYKTSCDMKPFRP